MSDLTYEQLRAAIMDIVTDAWDRSRQIDGAVDEIMDAVALAAQHPSQSTCKGDPGECTYNGACMYACGSEPSQSAGEPVAVLRWERETPGRENEMPRVVSCNRLPDGEYPVYLTPPTTVQQGAGVPVSDLDGMAVYKAACDVRDWANALGTVLENKPALLASIARLQKMVGSPPPTDAARASGDLKRDAWRGGDNYEASMLRSLLARIHGDGGHYVERNGLDKAIEDADVMVSHWRAGLTAPSPELHEIATSLRAAAHAAKGTHEGAFGGDGGLAQLVGMADAIDALAAPAEPDAARVEADRSMLREARDAILALRMANERWGLTQARRDAVNKAIAAVGRIDAALAAERKEQA